VRSQSAGAVASAGRQNRRSLSATAGRPHAKLRHMTSKPAGQDDGQSIEFRWIRIMLKPGGEPPPARTAAPKAPRQGPHRDPGKPLVLKVTYRGGATGWYEVEARGRTYHFPSDRALGDVMRNINGR